MNFMEMSLQEIADKLHDALYRYEKNLAHLFPAGRTPFPVTTGYAELVRYCQPKNEHGWTFWFSPMVKPEVEADEKRKKHAHKKLRVALKHLEYMNRVILNAREGERFHNTVEKWAGKPFQKRYTSTRPDRDVHPGC